MALKRPVLMAHSYFDLSGQTALITGAARGIGAGIAARLARAGATVAIADLNADAAADQAEKLRAEGLEAFSEGLDVANPSSVRAAVDSVLGRQGRIHVLVCCAGIAGKALPAWQQSDVPHTCCE